MGKALIDPLVVLASQAASEAKDFGYSAIESEHLQGNDIADITRLVGEGKTVHFLTDGAWSHHQLVMALILNFTGPASLYMSTYAISEASARCIATLKDDGHIKQLYCLIDNRVDTRTAGSLQLLKALANYVVLDACHAKATVIIGANASVVITGSANWTENNRKEIGTITNHPAAIDFHKKWISDAIRDNK